MPEQVSPTGDDWGAAPGPGSVPAAGSGPYPDRGRPDGNVGSAGQDWGTQPWTAPAGRGNGSVADSWGAPPAAASSGSFGPGAGPVPGGYGTTPTGVLPVAGSSGGHPVKPPIWILLIGLGLPIAALSLLLVDGLVAHILGWAIAIFGSVGALAAFTGADLRLRSSRWYVDQPALLAALRVAVLVVGLVVATYFAYLIADTVARWDVWF
ncbi:MAG: hypothetical protein ABJD68_08970 [Nakamurella sp.]